MCLNRIILIFQIFILSKIVVNTVSEICQSPECLEQVEIIKDSVDTTRDACDDFVEFACGKQFEKFAKIKRKSPAAMEPTSYQFHLWWVRKLLQKELYQPIHDDDPKSVRLAQIFWKKCTNTTPEAMLQSTRSLFKNLGGWPVITELWNGEKFSWDKFSKDARRFGIFPRMFIHVGLDVDDIKQPWQKNETIKLTIDRPMTIKTEVTELGQPMKNLAFFTVANLLKEKQKLEITEIDQAVTFSRELDTLPCDPNLSEPKIQTITIECLQKKYPIINWIEYLKAMMAPRQSQYLSNDNCVTVDICYLSAMEKFLNKTDKNIQANYAFQSIIADLFTVIRPQVALVMATNAKAEIEEICLDSTSVIFSRALDIMITKITDEKLQNKMKEIQNNIYEMTVEKIQNVSWMDLETQRQARKKLDAISFKTPVPDDIFNEKYFNRLELRQHESLSEMFLKVNNFLIDSYYLQVGRPRTRYGIYQNNNRVMSAFFQQIISPHEMMVKPERFSNTVNMPTAGILYPRLTTTKELDFVNYATIGIQIAAALSHHIYQKGAHIDPSGQWHRDSWWSKTTQEQFMSRKSCQAIGPMKPIADASTIFGLIGATEIAYFALFKDCTTKACSQKLRGLPYTAKQLFWISIVASDCDRNLKYRYNTMVSHIKNFTDDFFCGVHTNMHVNNKCKMWIN